MQFQTTRYQVLLLLSCESPCMRDKQWLCCPRRYQKTVSALQNHVLFYLHCRSYYKLYQGFFFHFRTQRNIPIIRGGPGPWSGRRPGVSGVSNPKRTIVQQQQCFLRMCKVMFAPKWSSRPGQPQGWHWKAAAPAAGGIPGAAIPSPSPSYCGEPQIPRLSLRHTVENRTGKPESHFPHFCSFNISLN